MAAPPRGWLPVWQQPLQTMCWRTLLRWAHVHGPGACLLPPRTASPCIWLIGVCFTSNCPAGFDPSACCLAAFSVPACLGLLQGGGAARPLQAGSLAGRAKEQDSKAPGESPAKAGKAKKRMGDKPSPPKALADSSPSSHHEQPRKVRSWHARQCSHLCGHASCEGLPL